MASTAITVDSSPIEPPSWPISVALYSEMVRTGFLNEYDPTYLWKGRLVLRTVPERPHSNALHRASAALQSLLPAGYFAEPGQPLALRFEASVPEPDVKVLRGVIKDYPSNFPTSADVPLILEVADSSLRFDRSKAATYAGEGIPVYVLANIPDNRVELYTDPLPSAEVEGAHYGTVTTFGIEDFFPVVIDGVEVGKIAVRAILG